MQMLSPLPYVLQPRALSEPFFNMSPVPLVCSQRGSHVEHAYLRGTEVVCKPCGFVQSLERRVTQGPRTFLETRILTDTLAAVCKLQVLRDLGEAPPPPPPQEDSWSFSEIMDPEILYLDQHHIQNPTEGAVRIHMDSSQKKILFLDQHHLQNPNKRAVMIRMMHKKLFGEWAKPFVKIYKKLCNTILDQPHRKDPIELCSLGSHRIETKRTT